jgi:hypothetical protein
MIGVERKREILPNIGIPKETVETAIRKWWRWRGEDANDD